jgi:signal transduction histidine kinase
MDQFLFDVQSALSRRVLEGENQRLMQRLQDINSQLEEKVRERTHELEQKNVELNRLSSFRADALKVLGHELRTPLAILSGYHALAAQGMGEGFTAVAPAMGDSIARLRQIVEKALHLLKATGATEFPLELEDVNPGRLCGAVAQRIQPFVVHRRIQIVPPAPCSEPRICRWDREKMEEVAEELLINAIRASPDGSSIEFALRTDGESVELAITDYGVGVPPERLEQIFEPFVTLSKPTHHSSGLFELGAEGVGIGLSTARMWVELHGGTLSAHHNESHPGMTFRVQMPICAIPRSATNSGGPSPATHQEEGQSPLHSARQAS